MLWTLLAMLLILVAAAAVVLYVAYPHRGADVPGAPWLGTAMRKGVDALPVLPDAPAQWRIPSQDDRLARHPDQRTEDGSTRV